MGGGKDNGDGERWEGYSGWVCLPENGLCTTGDPRKMSSEDSADPTPPSDVCGDFKGEGCGVFPDPQIIS